MGSAESNGREDENVSARQRPKFRTPHPSFRTLNIAFLVRHHHDFGQKLGDDLD